MAQAAMNFNPQFGRVKCAAARSSFCGHALISPLGAASYLQRPIKCAPSRLVAARTLSLRKSTHLQLAFFQRAKRDRREEHGPQLQRLAKSCSIRCCTRRCQSMERSILAKTAESDAFYSRLMAGNRVAESRHGASTRVCFSASAHQYSWAEFELEERK